jgi:hypothetical protein
MTAGDLQLFRTLYPSHSITVKMVNSSLSTVGYEGFTTLATNVKDYQIEGDTVIYSTNDGKLYRRVGLDGTNTQVWPASGSSGSVSTFLHSRGYLAVFTGSRLYTRTPTGNWVMQFGDGFQSRNKFRLDGERLYTMTFDASNVPSISLKYLTSSPNVFNYSQWVGTGALSVADFQARNGLLVVADNGNLWTRQYGVSGWLQVHSGAANGAAQKILLSDNLIVFYRVPAGSPPGFGGAPTGYASVIVGGPGNPPMYLSDPMYKADDMDVCGDKFAFLQQNAYLRVIDYSTWTVYEHYTMPSIPAVNMVRLGGGNCDNVTIQDYNANVWSKYGVSLGTDYFQYQGPVLSLNQRP